MRERERSCLCDSIFQAQWRLFSWLSYSAGSSRFPQFLRWAQFLWTGNNSAFNCLHCLCFIGRPVFRKYRVWFSWLVKVVSYHSSPCREKECCTWHFIWVHVLSETVWSHIFYRFYLFFILLGLPHLDWNLFKHNKVYVTCRTFLISRWLWQSKTEMHALDEWAKVKYKYTRKHPDLNLS